MNLTFVSHPPPYQELGKSQSEWEKKNQMMLVLRSVRY